MLAAMQVTADIVIQRWKLRPEERKMPLQQKPHSRPQMTYAACQPQAGSQCTAHIRSLQRLKNLLLENTVAACGLLTFTEFTAPPEVGALRTAILGDLRHKVICYLLVSPNLQNQLPRKQKANIQPTPNLD